MRRSIGEKWRLRPRRGKKNMGQGAHATLGLDSWLRVAWAESPMSSTEMGGMPIHFAGHGRNAVRRAASLS